MEKELNTEEIEIFRSMTPAQKLVLVDRFYQDARSLKRAALKTWHPEWSEIQIENKLGEIFLNARD